MKRDHEDRFCHIAADIEEVDREIMGEMKLAIIGAAGRMGRALLGAVYDMANVQLAGALVKPGSALLGQDAGLFAGKDACGIKISSDIDQALELSDGIIDFTLPQTSVEYADIAAKAGLVHIIGTTGFNAAQEEKIAQAAQSTPIVKSGNMSLGINLLSMLVEQTARILDDDFDIEIIEMHHRHKVDAPSGTALMLGRAAAEGRGVALAKAGVFSREGVTGARKKGDIGFAALRGGAVIGEHSAIFAGQQDIITLKHSAMDRAIYTRGAINAALWAFGRAPGLYSMRDVLASRLPQQT